MERARAPRPVRAPQPTQPGPNALAGVPERVAELQRLAGNTAVAQMLAGGESPPVPVQRHARGALSANRMQSFELQADVTENQGGRRFTASILNRPGTGGFVRLIEE